MALTVQQLLATLALDAAQVLALSDRFIVILRDPQDGDSDVPSAGTIYLRVVDLDGVPADPSTIAFEVYVDTGTGEVLAYDGTTPITPWDGALAAAGASTGADFYCWKDVRIDQAPVVYDSEALVTVRVALTISIGGWGHGAWGHFPWGSTPSTPSTDNVTYTFTAADTLRPSIVEALAVGPRTVRVQFDDSMAAGSGQATDPSAWSFTRLNVDPYPAVSLTCLAVDTVDVDATTFDLTTDWAMTIDGPYYVTVASTAEDDVGNLVDTDTATFSGYVPDAPAARAFDYWELCIPAKNKAEDRTQDLERFARTINETLGYLFAQVDHWVDEFNPDVCSDASIDMMLEDVGNPFVWSELDLDATQRRKLLRVLVDIYKLKGTAPGIEDVIYFLIGKVVTVVAYSVDGWILGEDVLGEDELARVVGTVIEPFNFAAAPLDLFVTTDAGPEAVTFLATDFADPTIATAQEVSDAINASMGMAASSVVAVGSPAVALSLAVEPFAVVAGDALALTVNGTPQAVTMHASDMAVSGAATAAEVAARITMDVPTCLAVDDGGQVRITTGLRGMTASIVVDGGTMVPALGWALTDDWVGADGASVAIYSVSPDIDAFIEIDAGVATTMLGLEGATSGVGTAILAPSTQRTIYTFDLESAEVLTATETTLVRRVAEYMKPAHTHLANVRLAPTLPTSGYWELGFGVLDEDSILGKVLG